MILAVLLRGVLGKFRVVERPEIPVGDFQEEPLVEFGTVERLLPRRIELNEIGEVVLLVERVEGEVSKDFDMSAVRVGEADVFDERDLFQHVLRLIALMQAAIDHCEREGVAMPEQEHRGHGEQAIHGAGDAGKLGAGVVRLRQRDGKEQIRLNRRAIPFAFALEKKLLIALRGGTDFVVGELEQKIHRLPVGNQRVFGIERFVFGEVFGESFCGVRFENDALLAFVAERFKERGRGVNKWLIGKTLERVLDATLGFDSGGHGSGFFARRFVGQLLR